MGNYVATMSRAVAGRGYQVVVAGPSDSPMARLLDGGDVEVVDWLSSRHPAKGLRADVQRLGRIVETVQPDVVHLLSSKAGLVGRLALRGRLPTVFQPQAWSYDALAGPMVAAAVSWERLAGRWTDVLLTVSVHERDSARSRGISASAIEVVPNPVNCDMFQPADGKDSPRPILPIDQGPVALCVGRLCRQKGQDDLVAAWPMVRSYVPDAQLVLAGDGPMRAELEPMIDESITLLGNRSDVPDLFRQADLAVMPSRWEGMSLAMLEAMASGLSLVATDVAGVSETVGRGAGAVVAIGDRRQLADAITVRLLDPDMRAEEGRLGRQIALSDHSIEGTTSTLCQIYDSLIGAASARSPRSRVDSP